MSQGPIGFHPRVEQAVEIFAGGEYGSGYRISERLIITSRHVVPIGVSPVTVRVRTREVSAKLQAEVVWRAKAQEVDIALLRLLDTAPSIVPDPAVFGDLGLAPAKQLEFQAIGFPAHKRQKLPNAMEQRDTDHVIGRIPAAANVKAGILDLLHSDRTHTRGDDWRGMSGAAVFAHDHLVGIVIEAETKDTPLRAVPITLAVGWREEQRRVSEPADSVDALREILADDGVSARAEPVRLRTAYGARIRQLAEEAGELIGRGAELEQLAEFARSDRCYEWWIGAALAGKTTLAAHFAVDPPNGVDVVAYFVRKPGPLQGMSFTKAICDQLASLLGIPAPNYPQSEHLADLWQQTKGKAHLTGRRLLLVVDGVDENCDDDRVTALLPTNVDDHAKVLVFSRPVPRSTLGVPPGHPLLSQTRCPEVDLTTSPHASIFPVSYEKVKGASSIRSHPVHMADDIDTVLSGLDELLESNPEDFIRNFVQRNGNGGGQYAAFLEGAIEQLGSATVYEVMGYIVNEIESEIIPGEIRLRELYRAIRNEFGTEVARIFSGPLSRVESLLGLCEVAHEYPGVTQYSARHGNTERSSPESDFYELRLRDRALAAQYSDAESELDKAVNLDPGRADRLSLEFGFLYLNEQDRELVAGLWSQLAVGNDYPLQVGPVRDVKDVKLKVERTTVDSPASTEPTGSVVTPPARTAHRPEDIEPAEALAALLDSIFLLSGEQRNILLGWSGWRVENRHFGDTVAVDCFANDPRRARCRIELIDTGSPLRLQDLAASLITHSAASSDPQLDHLVFVSPRNDPDSQLAEMISSWNGTGTYSFIVQVWSPANGFRELIRQRPQLFEYVYGETPQERTASSESLPAALWNERLAPPLRVAASWQRYLKDPALHCLANENAEHFNEVYQRQAELRAMDGRGRNLDGTLRDNIMDWLKTDETSLLILAEFGEGKSFFTYSLSRHLCEQLVRAPGSGIFPLRLPLRELHKAGGPRQLLEWRLSEIGADLHGWNDLGRQFQTLIILDGFDEMSVELTPKAVRANIIALSQCYEAFKRSKVIITSRGRFFDGGRDEERLLDRIGRPRAIHIAPVSRGQCIGYLESIATASGNIAKLQHLQRMYDPIGLAAKPLFLQMMSETLAELPSDDFSELILYRTYVKESLSRKIDLLEDPQLDTSRGELIENLQNLLADIAIELHRSHGKPVFLNDLADGPMADLATMLWNMRDDAMPGDSISAEAQADATARIGIRSLLKTAPAEPMERWPVDFFHRSMREYFVACGIVKALQEDAERARGLLGALPPQPEITRFVAELLSDSGSAELTERLQDLARSTRAGRAGEHDKYLGGNAVTLLNAHCSRLPGSDWSELCLDYAWLPDIDLSGMSLRGSSLFQANLDNANLENSDFTRADLTGVRLEETSRIFALATTGTERIFAGYEDRSIREWVVKPGVRQEVSTVATLEHRADRLHCTPSGTMIAMGESRMTVLTRESSIWRVLASFKVKSMLRPPVFDGAATLLVREDTSGSVQAIWYDPHKRRGYGTTRLADYRDGAQVGGKIGVVATVGGVLVFTPPSEGSRPINLHELPRLSSVAVSGSFDTEIMVATGHDDGTVKLSRLLPDESGFSLREIWTRELHDGAVSSVAFFGDGYLVSGGMDKAVCVTQLEPGTDHHIRRLYLSIRCRGMRYEGVRGEREQSRLREIAAKYE